MVHRPLDERDVDTELEQRPQYRPGIRAGYLDPHARMPKVESPEVGREHIRRDRSAGTHAKHAPLEPAELPKLSFGDPLDTKELARSRVEHSSGVREGDGLARAV